MYKFCTKSENPPNPMCSLFQTELKQSKTLKLICRCFDLKLLFGLEKHYEISISTSFVVDYENDVTERKLQTKRQLYVPARYPLDN